MGVNEYQIGGKHYRTDYQHWDFCTDTNIHFLLGNAIKYLVRWREKGGVQDLRKCSHYIAKAEECGVYFKWLFFKKKNVAKYRATLGPDEQDIFSEIIAGDYAVAQRLLAILVNQQ
jgi:hypothetical protein